MLTTTARRMLALALLTAASGAAQAAFTVYTSRAAFDAATSAPGLDDYSGFSTADLTLSPLPRTTLAGARHDYIASAPNNLYGAGAPEDPWMSTNDARDALTLGGFATDVRGIGGNFFTSLRDLSFGGGGVVLFATDIRGQTTEWTVSSARLTDFVGFVSDVAIDRLMIVSVPTTPDFHYATADNFVIALGAVPEPGSAALWLAGLAAVAARPVRSTSSAARLRLPCRRRGRAG